VEVQADIDRSSRGEAVPFPRVLAWLARLAARVFFRRLEVVGNEAIPPRGPLLIVANHQNSLIDPILIVASLARAPRFLGKAPLWQNRILLPFLHYGRVIPVHRRHDPGFDPGRNEETFDAARGVLEQGGAIALFPEGRSHSEPRLVEIRTGAARIAAGLDRQARAELAIVPVGLHFEDKGRFRSGALVRIGQPLEVGSLPVDTQADARRLTEHIAQALDAVTVSYPSVEVARRVERAVEIALLDSDRQGPSKRPPLEQQVAWRKRVSRAYERLRLERPGELADLESELDAWDRLLAAVGLRDDELARAPLPGRRRTLIKLVVRMTIEAPLAVLGGLLHWPAYRAVAAIGERVEAEPDLPATYKVFGGLIFFPLTWLLLGVAVAAAGATWPWVVAAIVLGPLLGVAALRLLDRRASLRGLVRSMMVLAPAGRRERLLERRRQLRQRLLALAEDLEEDRP
jgi:1-acyl-sn-glycerol-3-phosphate acyltransferase